MSGRSGAGWSEPGARASVVGDRDGDRDGDSDAGHSADNDNERIAATAPDAFAIAEHSRYEGVGRIGRGGMGDVAVALDRRLDRDVACKRIALDCDSPDATERLAREARITARLEHPNIVPVYDAGTDSDGRVFYTMRLIRGRSLARVLDEAAPNDDRAPLLRHYLDACHAVAYAHSQGIVHRDIKPANIVVGGFGETQVVDWGLAESIGTAPARTGVGTAGFMSPEQSRGAPLRASADVWSLGAVLDRIVGDDERAPDDLRAVARKALAEDPNARYPTAAALAADIERYLDDQRVTAHAYSPWELLVRAVRAWRLPLAIAAAGAVAIAVVAASSVVRIRTQRNLAVGAEQRAVEALARAETTLGWALDNQAVAVLEGGAMPEAEVLAAHALVAAESADARGVLASAYAGTRPDAVENLERPDCGRLRLAPDGLAVCITGDELSLWELDPLRRRWRVASPALDAAVVEGDVAVSLATRGVDVFDGRSGERVESVHDLGKRHGLAVSADGARFAVSNGEFATVLDGRTRARLSTLVPCPGGFTNAIAVAGPHFASICRGGSLVVTDATTGAVVARTETPFGASLRPALTMAAGHGGFAFAIGGIGGQVAVARLDDAGGLALGPVTRVSEGSIKELEFFREALVVVPDRGPAALWDPDSGAQLLTLPDHASGTVRVDGDSLVSCGVECRRWQLPRRPRPRRFLAPAGLAGAAVSPDGSLVAAARGDGRVTVWERATGRTAADLDIARAVVKSVAFSPDGTRLAAGVADDDARTVVYDVASWSRLPYDRPEAGARRIGFLADGSLVAQQYGQGYALWTPDGVATMTWVSLAADMDTGDGDRAVMLTEQGPVFEIAAGRPPRYLFDAPVGRAIATLPDRAGYAIADAGGVWLRRDGHRDGGRVRLRSRAGDVTDIAVSADGRWLAAATKRGHVEVFSLATDRLVATLRGHTERVAHVFFASGALVSASWDGSIRLWDLAPLAAEAGALARQAEATWGTSLDLALGRGSPTGR